jgi:multiple sugar transport system permease protein
VRILHRRNEQQVHGLLYTAPVPIFLGLFIAFPLASNVWLAVTSSDGKYVGLKYFLKVLSDPSMWSSALLTAFYVALSVVFQLLLGTITGIVLNRALKGRSFFRSAILIPWVVPASVAATTWAWMYHPAFGIVALIMTRMGVFVKMGLLSTPSTVICALAFVNIWKMFPFVAVMVLAGLQAIDPQLYEASTMDGANVLQKTRYITLPFLRNVLFSLLILLSIWGFNGITIIFTMTRGGPADLSLVLPLHIYREAFQYFLLNLAAAESSLLVVGLAILIAFYLKLMNPRGDVE